MATTEIHLAHLVPPPIVLVDDEDGRVEIPGEVTLKDVMRIEGIRGDIWAARMERQEATTRAEERDAREALRLGWQAAADLIHELALREHPEAAPLELTVTQIETILTMLVSPAERELLIARAVAGAMGIPGVPDFDPLESGSSTRSDSSDEPED